MPRRWRSAAVRQCRVALALAVLRSCCWRAGTAVEPDEILTDPALEARARAISAGLRCLVCQNQSIDDSNAPLARDLRLLVRERLTAGDSDAQVLRFVEDRYGEFVLLSRRSRGARSCLWLTPLAGACWRAVSPTGARLAPAAAAGRGRQRQRRCRPTRRTGCAPSSPRTRASRRCATSGAAISASDAEVGTPRASILPVHDLALAGERLQQQARGEPGAGMRAARSKPSMATLKPGP